MTKRRERAAAMFETLAVLHLHFLTPQGERGETNPRVEGALSGLQHKSKRSRRGLAVSRISRRRSNSRSATR
jgi:hypothetical protein